VHLFEVNVRALNAFVNIRALHAFVNVSECGSQCDHESRDFPSAVWHLVNVVNVRVWPSHALQRQNIHLHSQTSGSRKHSKRKRNASVSIAKAQ
jgi:hypothetical protein